MERIELHSSRLDTDVIDELLQLPRALKTLVYSDAGTEYERMKLSFWEVLMHTSDSLENLSVRWKETGGFIENDYMWTLHSFSCPDNLQILEPLVQMAMDRGVHVALTQADLGSLPF